MEGKTDYELIRYNGIEFRKRVRHDEFTHDDLLFLLQRLGLDRKESALVEEAIIAYGVYRYGKRESRYFGFVDEIKFMRLLRKFSKLSEAECEFVFNLVNGFIDRDCSLLVTEGAN